MELSFRKPTKELRQVVTVVHGDWPQSRKAVKCEAVWDTGCSITLVTARLAETLGLRRVEGMKMLLHAGTGDAETERYEAWLVLQPGEQPVKVLVGVMPQPDTDVLIGLDVICRGRFEVDASGTDTIMRFGVP